MIKNTLRATINANRHPAIGMWLVGNEVCAPSPSSSLMRGGPAGCGRRGSCGVPNRALVPLVLLTHCRVVSHRQINLAENNFLCEQQGLCDFWDDAVAAYTVRSAHQHAGA